MFKTQRPDAASIPKATSDNAILRFCLAVTGHMADNLVLGSGAYARSPRAVRVTCEPRAMDEGADWFWTHWGDPLAPADDIVGAEVALVGHLTAK